MIIGVNLLPLRIEGGGTRHFAESLLLELTNQPFSARYLLLLLCLPEMRGHLEKLFTGKTNVSLVTVHNESDLERCQELFDIYFCPLNALWPLLPSKPSVACLMDIQEQFMPEYFSARDLELRGRLYPSLIHDATVACTISEYCGRTFVEKMNADPDKVKVVRLFPQKKVLETHAELPADCPASFMLYPANWYKHKNHRNLVEGYLAARKRNPDEFPALVLVGHPMGNADWLKELAAPHQSGDQIKIYTEITPECLRGLYEKCQFVILPTLFEGYCMPLAEAILLGRPVLANDLPVMREVGGDWPVYASLNESTQIADAMGEMLLNPSLTRLPPLPPALKEWGWKEIAAEYDIIFHQALMMHRLRKSIS